MLYKDKVKILTNDKNVVEKLPSIKVVGINGAINCLANNFRKPNLFDLKSTLHGKNNNIINN